MRKERFIIFKREVSNSFLKTVSAYSNIGTGIIKFDLMMTAQYVDLMEI